MTPLWSENNELPLLLLKNSPTMMPFLLHGFCLELRGKLLCTPQRSDTLGKSSPFVNAMRSQFLAPWGKIIRILSQIKSNKTCPCYIIIHNIIDFFGILEDSKCWNRHRDCRTPLWTASNSNTFPQPWEHQHKGSLRRVNYVSNSCDTKLLHSFDSQSKALWRSNFIT